jgi:hypothetical protein
MTKFLTIISNLTGSVRREQWRGRKWIVAPATLVVEGVLNGSRGKLLYLENDLRKTVAAWEQMPITLGHPKIGGEFTSVRTAGVLDRLGIGIVRSPTVRNGRLRAEAWFDLRETRRKAPNILAKLKKNEPIELSTGIFTEPEARSGSWNGKRYIGIARVPQPDHLAVFAGDEIGACSIRDGCGVLNTGDRKMLIDFEPDLDMLSLPMSLNELLANERGATVNSCGCGRSTANVHREDEDDDILVPPSCF